VSSKHGEDDEPDPTSAHEGVRLRFRQDQRAQIAGVSPLRWRTVTEKISTSPSSVEIVRHSSYNSSTLPEILPCPLTLIFPYFFSIFSFLPRLLTKQLKNQKLQKKKKKPL
jgi:hypothetical protein